MPKTIRIGTRGSQLALYQANTVKDELQKKFPQQSFSIVVVKTKGDKILDVPLSKIGDKGLFTKELEIAMFEDEIDMAVHSLKDLPTRFPEGVKLGAVLKRGEVRDALISSSGRTLQSLTSADIIATSSLRRKAQLLRINPDFNIVEIRGNVNTRIRKMEEGYCTVMVMAGAGLQRLGMDSYIAELLDLDLLIPACSQGAIAIEMRQNDPEIAGLLASVDDRQTRIACEAERAFLRTLEGGCQIPVGSYSQIKGDQFFLTGFVSGIDGRDYLKDTIQGPVAKAESLAIELAENLLKSGGWEILKSIRPEGMNEAAQELPLTGRTLISTRAPEAGDTLPDLMAKQGAELLSMPMIEIKAKALTTGEGSCLRNLAGYDWVFFTSRNGVINFFKHLIDQTGSSALPEKLRLAVLGQKTASELEYYGFTPHFTGQDHGSGEMASEFAATFRPSGQKILLALGNLADNTLSDQLSDHNQVDRIDVYETSSPRQADRLLMNRIADGRYDLIIFTSPSTFHHFKELADPALLSGLKMASIGATTTRAIREAGLEPLVTAQVSNAEGLVDSILLFYQQS